MADPTPMWRMPTRAQAIDILIASRTPLLELIEGLEDSHMKTQTLLGGVTWTRARLGALLVKPPRELS
jgi:hypothetical protein